ncbi:MAG: DNA mismatch repair endonuclease MutL [Gemmatimonadota bacterium]|nr:DNA mismatch repair endonuclease MutL [Gemmatimonadota bacterium]
MARRIHILPDTLANQIAAGEVVERPASVVKELVENALDAGASRVEVAVRNGGKTEIRVTDDGSGMGREDALLSLDRHATSKIREPRDLAAISTLGFRGEALPSIASVARLSLETADREGEGTRLVVTGGKLTAVEACARRRGTTICVRNLFFNTPARAKFLRSVAAEMRAISEVVTTLALAYPATAFRLDSNGRELLDLPAVPDVRGRIAALWGEQAARELIPVTHREGSIVLTGRVQRPNSATPGTRRAYLFVGSRSFSDRSLLRAAERGYRTTIAPGVRPSLFLFLEVADGEVDVNVHPTKAEVRFRDPNSVERVIEEGVRAALGTLASAPHLARSATEASAAAPAPEAPPPPPEEEQITLFVAGQPVPADDAAEHAENGPLPTGSAPLPELSRPAMWQVHNTYILAETRGGLIIVDQHSAHERVLYEQLMQHWANGGAASQRLLFPITLRLSPSEYALVEELSSLLARAGFEVEPFGSRSIIVHAVPNPHPYFDAERCLREMVAELTDGSPLVDAARTQHQRIALSFACKAAIKAGQRLSQQEISELFDRLFATELPYHDIHGRPTIVQLSLSELHQRFGRE